MPIVNNELSFGLAGAQGGIIGAKGAPLVAAATITVTDSFHEVSGAGVITTINCDALAPNSLLFLRVAAGSTWSLGVGGNVETAIVATPNETVALEWDGTSLRSAGGNLGNAILRSGGLQPLTADLDLGAYAVESRNSVNVYNIMAYGGNPDGFADNTAAINALLAAIPATGGVAFFPAGTYRATGPFTVSKGTTIIGEGMTTTIFTNMADADFFYSPHLSSLQVYFRDFRIQSPVVGRTQGAGIHLVGGATPSAFEIENVYVVDHWNGYHLTYPVASSLRNARAQSCDNWGFFIENPTTSLVLQATFASACGRAGMGRDTGGYYFKYTGPTTEGTRYSSLLSTACDASIGVGYRFDYCHDVSLNAIGCEQPTVAGGGSDSIYINNCYGLTITSPYLTDGDAGINITNSDAITITGGSARRTASPAIYVTGSSGVTIINPSFDGVLGDGIWVGGGSTAVNVVDPNFITAPGGVQINDAAGVVTKLAAGALTPSAPILLPNGAVGAPSLSFAGDPNTGLYSSAADTLAVACGGGAKWTFNSSGLLYPASTNVVSLGSANFVLKTVYVGTSLQAASTKALTAGAATGFVKITTVAGDMLGGQIEYTIEAKDAVNLQARSGILKFSIVNRAGTSAVTIVADAGEAFVETAGASTLTNTMTATVAGNDVTFLANAVSSLVETTLRIRYRMYLTGTTPVTGL